MRKINSGSMAVALASSLVLLAACDSSSTEEDATSTESTASSPTTDTQDSDENTATNTIVAGNFNSAMFSDALVSSEEVSCELDNGTTSTCYQITFTSNGAGDNSAVTGPYCPENLQTARSEAGTGFYDGVTNPGYLPIVDAIEAMAADGFDIVDDEGNVNIQVPGSGQQTDASLHYCLEAAFDSDLELAFLIPIEPEFRESNWVVGALDSVGVGVNGVPLKGNPPGVSIETAGVGGSGTGNIPSLDICGGHPDPAGYYHWHMVPQGTNTVLSSATYNYTQDYGMVCNNTNISFDEPTSFAGLMKDGFPYYGPFDSVDSVETQPSDVATLDECNGHTHATVEFPDGVYHYHALQDTAPNFPPCLKGSFAENDWTIVGQQGGGRPAR